MMPAVEDTTSLDPKKRVQKSWADQMAADTLVDDMGEFGGADEDFTIDLPPPKEIIDGDTKIVTAYKYNDEGKKVKTLSYYRIEKRQVSKSIAQRKNWKKFGKSEYDPPGPNPSNTSIVNDDIFLQFISNRDDDHLDASREGGTNDLSKLGGSRSIVKCRICEQDHFTTKCPYKDKFELLSTLKEKEGTPSTTAAAAGASAAAVASDASKTDDGKKTSGKYVPPSMREGGNKRGDVMTNSKSKDEPNTIRVTNLPEEILDSDIKELFTPFGRVVRIFLAKDKYTGQSKGFAFVSFEKREDAAAAIKAVNGFGYANLILSVEWAKPSNN